MAAEFGVLSSTRAQKRRSASVGPASLGRPMPVDPGPMSVSGSPNSFLVGVHLEAPSLSAPTRDMTVSERTRAYQHMVARAGVISTGFGDFDHVVSKTNPRWQISIYAQGS